MADLFRNKYRIPSARLQTWNYADEGLYFITINTAHREHYFGTISEQQMQLSIIGKVAENEWYKTLSLRPDMNLQCGEFVVMPNHIHGILSIGANDFNTEDALNQNRFMPQSKNLAAVMRGYKSAVTAYAKENDIPFGWQSRFYDHIIRSYEEYQRISLYIANNIKNWQQDKCYSRSRPSIKNA